MHGSEGAHERKHPFIDVKSDQSVQKYPFSKMDDKQHPIGAAGSRMMIFLFNDSPNYD